MKKIVIFGNSASGKSTLAKQLSKANGLAHLDLDTLAWKPTTPPERKSIAESKLGIDSFFATHKTWVIEGCYSDLLELAVAQASEVIFLNLPIETCIANAKERPWEPHKYQSKAAQDANLEMLVEWIAQYQQRADTFSESAHQALFDSFEGKKTWFNKNQR